MASTTPSSKRSLLQKCKSAVEQGSLIRQSYNTQPVPAPMRFVSPVLQGSLMFQLGSIFRKLWVTKWVIVANRCLYYYTSIACRGTEIGCGSLDLAKCTTVKTRCKASKSFGMYCIIVVADEAKNKLKIRVPEPAEHQRWLKVISDSVFGVSAVVSRKPAPITAPTAVSTPHLSTTQVVRREASKDTNVGADQQPSSTAAVLVKYARKRPGDAKGVERRTQKYERQHYTPLHDGHWPVCLTCGMGGCCCIPLRNSRAPDATHQRTEMSTERPPSRLSLWSGKVNQSKLSVCRSVEATADKCLDGAEVSQRNVRDTALRMQFSAAQLRSGVVAGCNTLSTELGQGRVSALRKMFSGSKAILSGRQHMPASRVIEDDGAFSGRTEICPLTKCAETSCRITCDQHASSCTTETTQTSRTSAALWHTQIPTSARFNATYSPAAKVRTPTEGGDALQCSRRQHSNVREATLPSMAADRQAVDQNLASRVSNEHRNVRIVCPSTYRYADFESMPRDSDVSHSDDTARLIAGGSITLRQWMPPLTSSLSSSSTDYCVLKTDSDRTLPAGGMPTYNASVATCTDKSGEELTKSRSSRSRRCRCCKCQKSPVSSLEDRFESAASTITTAGD